uniref:Uncharacterized protein n=1 Tax=Ditylenchus dipsaci TaxID=166011 RepID=A0A915DNZ7_9BILA
MNKAFFACLKCVKPTRSEEDYEQFCKAVRNLLLTDELADKKKIIEEFALADSSYYLFTIIAEGIANFRSTKSLKNRLFLTAMKILGCVLNDEFQRHLHKQLKCNYSLRLREIYKGHMSVIINKACALFLPEREVGKKSKKAATKAVSAEEVEIASTVFHVYIGLGTQSGNQLSETKMMMISSSLDALHDVDPTRMSTESFQLLCSSFHNLFAEDVYKQLRSSISQIYNSLKSFRGDYPVRRSMIKRIKKKFDEADREMEEED